MLCGFSNFFASGDHFSESNVTKNVYFKRTVLRPLEDTRFPNIEILQLHVLKISIKTHKQSYKVNLYQFSIKSMWFRLPTIFIYYIGRFKIVWLKWKGKSAIQKESKNEWEQDVVNPTQNRLRMFQIIHSRAKIVWPLA